MHSASIVDNATADCLCDVHETSPPFTINTYPVFKILSTGFDPQAASENPIAAIFGLLEDFV